MKILDNDYCISLSSTELHLIRNIVDVSLISFKPSSELFNKFCMFRMSTEVDAIEKLLTKLSIIENE